MGFFSDLDTSPQPADSTKSKGFFGDLSSEEPVKESKLPGMGRKIARDARVVGTTLAGLPGDIFGSIQKGVGWAQKAITGQEMPEQVQELSKQLSPFGNLPTSEEALQGVDKTFPSLAPQTPQEKESDEQLALLTSLVTPIPGGGAKAIDPRHMSKIFKAGKAIGLSEKELTPLIQGTAKEQLLGKIAKKTQGLRAAVDVTKNKLGDYYDTIINRANRFGPVKDELASKLTDKFAKIQMRLENTLKASPDTESAVKYIQGVIENSNNYGVTPSKLVNTYREINKAVNWNAVKGGKKVLAQLKEPLLETLKKAAPTVEKDLSNFNMLYSKMKGFEKSVGIGKIGQWLEANKAASMLGKIALGAFGGSVVGIAPVAKAYAAIEASRLVATKLLTDPKWQNLHNKILTAIKNQSFSAAPKLLQILKKKTKEEMPEDYDLIDWDQSTP